MSLPGALHGQVRHLVLTHLQPGVVADRSRADATDAFGAPVAVAAIDDHHEVQP